MRFPTTTSRNLTFALITSIGLSASASVLADHHGEKEYCDIQKFSERMEKRHTEHLARLYAALKITPAQESAWKAYAESSQHRPPPAKFTDVKNAPSDAPARMDRMVEMHKLMGDRLQDHSKAVKALYAVLSSEQRKAFDEYQGRHGHGHGHPERRAPASQEGPAGR